jgi:hypothetical protein
MGTELDRLFVTLEADLSNYQAGLKRAGADLDTFTRDAERKSTAAGKAIEAGLAAANNNARLTGQQVQQLGFQLNDIATSLASGISPFQTLAQQGGQVYQALSMNGGVAQGLAGVKNGIAENVTASRLLAGGFAAAGAAAVYLGYSYVSAQDDIKKGLTGIGAASGATVKDIDAIATRISVAKSISISAARDIATSIAATGKVNVGNIEGVAGLVPGYARIFGKDLETAGQEMATIFAEPIAGADLFIKKLGGINDQTRQLIQNLVEQGKRQEAINALQGAVSPVINAAQDARSPQRKLLDTILQRGSQALDFTGRVAAATVSPEGTDEDQLRDAQNRLAIARKAQSALPSLFGGQDSLANMAVEALQQNVDELTRKLADAAVAKDKAFDARKAEELSLAAGAIVRSLDPEGQALQKFENQLTALGGALATAVSNPDVAIDGGIEKAITQYGALQTKVDALRTAYAAGGVAAQNALRAADFSAQQAGLSSYERGLQAIVRQFADMAKAARESGTAAGEAAAKTYEAASGRAQDAYRTQNVERARGEISVPSDYYGLIRSAESGTNDRAVSETGAVGRYQFIKSTWLSLFQDVKSSRYAEIQKANTGADGTVDQKAVQAAVLALRNDPDLQEELVRALTIRNAASLDKEGFAPTSRNLYAAHNIGAGGASALLRAERDGRGGETAQSILDPISPNLTSANRAYYGGGKTVTESLAILQQKTLANSASARAAKEDVIATEAQTQSIGKSAVEASRLKSINDDLRASRERGEEAGLKFATAEDLLKASSTGLTGELKAQTDQILANADARSRASAVSLNTRFQTDQRESRAALGRTYEENAAYSQARSYGAAPGTDGFKQAYDGIRDLQGLTDAKNYTGSFLKDLNYDLMNAKSLGDAALSSVQRLLSKVADKGIDKIVSSLFAPSGGGAGIFDGIAKFFSAGFSGGGFTGAGGTYEPAGIVHRGEVVFSQEDVRRHGGVNVVEGIRRGLKGFAAGGIVGAMPRMPMAQAARPSSAGASVRMGDININAPGADREGLMQLRSYVDAGFQESRRTIGQQLAGWKENN